MPTLRSASREDEVVVPSERQSSLRSASNSPSRKRARHDGFTTPERPLDEDEIEVPPAPKKRTSPRARTPTKKAAQNMGARFQSGDKHRAKTTSKALKNDRIASYPTPEPSIEANSRPDSPEASMTGNEKRNKTSIHHLPTELIQMVMIDLPQDRDVTNFALAGKVIAQCYTRSIIVARFAQIFDALKLPRLEDESESERNQRQLRSVYNQFIKRTALTLRDVSFAKWGNAAERSQTLCVDTLTSVILTSNASLVRSVDTGEQQIVGLNHDWLFKYFKNEGNQDHKVGTDLLHYVEAGRTVPHKAVSRGKKAIQKEVALKLCFVHLMLNPRIPQLQSRFADSQSAVYTCIRREPLFKGKLGHDINFTWLEHAANFFKYHFRQQNGEGLLTHLIDDLPDRDLPRAWPGRLENGTKKLGPKWKGAFTYIGDDAQLRALRNGTLQESAEDETSEDNDGFQDLTIFNDIAEHEELQYPELYEQELKSMPRGPYVDHITGEKINPGYKDFFGLGKAKTDYHLYGRMHSLPAQADIPGWQRVTMMKEMPDEATKTYGQGLTAIWAYEGVVLPGGQVILGRWWSPFMNNAPGSSYSGPFIFWQVSSKVEKNPILDALDFVRYVKNNTY